MRRQANVRARIAAVGRRDGGFCAFKIPAFESHPGRFPRIPADQVLDLLEASAGLDLPVDLHNEDQEVVRARVARFAAAGRTAIEHHAPSRPTAAERAATATFLELGAATGAHVHIVHLPVPRGYDRVDRYRAEKPAKVFGLWPRKGALTVGADADVAVIEPATWVYDAADAHDGLRWSRYDGRTFTARVAASLVRGGPAWDGARICGRPGVGRFVPRRPAAGTGGRIA